MADTKDETIDQTKEEDVEDTTEEIVQEVRETKAEVIEKIEDEIIEEPELPQSEPELPQSEPELPQSEPELPQPEPEQANENENGKMSSKSSDISIISIEEIGPEDVAVDKVENAEVLIPEEPETVAQKVEPKLEEKVVEKVEAKKEEEVKAEPVKEEVIEEIVREPERTVQRSAEKSVSEDEEEDDEDDDDFDDETILERLVGLTEMFPEGLTHMADASASGLVSGLKWAYKASRTVTWIVCTSASIMFLPIMIETERMGIEEAQKQQQRQILLGPGAAMSGGNAQVNAPLPAAMS